MTDIHVSALPERPVDPGWLALREPADEAARDAAADAIVTPLLDQLRARLTIDGLRVIDLGAGTGANLRWLGPRLAELVAAEGLPHHWTLVDHDPRLAPWGPIPGEQVQADVTDLAALLARLPRPQLVTATALLDLLTWDQLDAVVHAVHAERIPVLFSLSVTGEAAIEPGHPLDLPLKDAFDAHQWREGRLGPDAGYEAAQRFRQLGWTVIEASTPWRLDAASQGTLLDAWLEGRAEAAVEWEARLAAPAAEWLAERRRQIAAGRLSALVGHVDVLALPPA